MKDFLKGFFDGGSDGICFFPHEDFEDVVIKSFVYKRKNKPEVSANGITYHIMLYKIDDFGQVYSRDNFTAILTDPAVYVDWIIRCGFYGLVSKKTRYSSKFVKEIFDQIK